MAVLAAIFGWFSTPTMSVAVPAPRRPVEVVQPDGSVLSVFKAGDEFLHVAFSPEGYTLKADNQGIYRYAIHDEIGQLVAALSKPWRNRPPIRRPLHTCKPCRNACCRQTNKGKPPSKPE
jgi:hypothetical protein